MFGLTKRQVICFGIGLVMGLPAFFLTKSITSNLTIAVFALGVFSAPGIFCGVYQKNGQHLEDRIKLMVRFFKLPRIKTYQSENIYDAIERNSEFEKYKKILRKAGINYVEKEVDSSWRKKFSLLKKK